MIKSEKIFLEGGIGVLKQLNLHNANDAFNELQSFIDNKIEKFKIN